MIWSRKLRDLCERDQATRRVACACACACACAFEASYICERDQGSVRMTCACARVRTHPQAPPSLGRCGRLPVPPCNLSAPVAARGSKARSRWPAGPLARGAEPLSRRRPAQPRRRREGPTRRRRPNSYTRLRRAAHSRSTCGCPRLLLGRPRVLLKCAVRLSRS